MPTAVHPIILYRPKAGTGIIPWKTTASSSNVGFGTNYPLGFTYSELVRYFYGVKDYTFSVTAVGTNHGAGGGGPDVTFNVTHSETVRASFRDTPAFAGYTTELDYVTDARARFFIESKTTTVSSVYEANLLAIWMNVSGAFSGGFIFAGDYYPHLQLGYHLIDNTPSGGGDIGIFASGVYPFLDSYTNGAEGPNNSGTFATGSFFGKTMTIFGMDNNPITLTSCSLSVSSTSWWEYDPGDGGGPIWNATTGAQIRDPFNL